MYKVLSYCFLREKNNNSPQITLFDDHHQIDPASRRLSSLLSLSSSRRFSSSDRLSISGISVCLSESLTDVNSSHASHISSLNTPNISLYSKKPTP